MEEAHQLASGWASRRKTRVCSRFLCRVCCANKEIPCPSLLFSGPPGRLPVSFTRLWLRRHTKTKGQGGLRLHERFENKGVSSSPTVPETRDQREKLFPKPHRKPRLCKFTHDVSPASRTALVPSFPLIPALTNY